MSTPNDQPPAQQRAIAAGVVVGLVAAAIALAPVGVGMSVMLLAWLLGGLVVGSWPPTPTQRVFAALALLAVPLPTVFTLEGWLLVAVFVAFATALLMSVADPERPVWSMLLAWPLTMWAPVPLVRTLRFIARPVGVGVAMRTVRAGLLALALVSGFGLLLASADQAFADLLARAVPENVDLPVLFVRGLVGGIFGWTASGVLLCAAPAQPVLPELSSMAAYVGDDTSRRDLRRLGDGSRAAITEWRVGLISLVALFAAFVAVQVPLLVDPAAQAALSEELGHANVARAGFFQLLWVVGIVMVVVAVAVGWTRADAVDVDADAPADTGDPIVRGAAGALLCLTVIVLASAWQRVAIYLAVHGATRLRAAVVTTMVWLAVVLVIVAVGVVARRRAATATVIVASALLAVLGHAWSNPDVRAATTNLALAADGGKPLDLRYLAVLGADASGVWKLLPPAHAACVTFWAADDVSPTGLSWTLSRRSARLASDGPTDAAASACARS